MSDVKQFIDSNILIYAYDTAAGQRHAVAKQLVRELFQTGNGALSIQVLQEFHNIATRRITHPLTTSQSASLLKGFQLWSVHTPSVADVVSAIDLQTRYQTSFWDALILHSAAQLNCPILFTEDLNHTQFYGAVQVINPFIQ